MENNEYEFTSELETPQEQPVARKSKPKLLPVVIGAALVALIAVVVMLFLGNTYKTPIKAVEKLLNSKSLSQVLDRAPAVLNGFGEKEAKKLIKLVKKSDQYKEQKDELEEDFKDSIEELKEAYGKNYKISIKIKDKEKIDDKDIFEEYEESLHTLAEYAEKALAEVDSDDYEDLAEEMGLSKSQVKDAVKSLEKFAKKCTKAKVTAGYDLDLVVKFTGSEMDEPEETELTARVYKINGRWFIDPLSALGSFGFSTSDLLGLLY